MENFFTIYDILLFNVHARVSEGTAGISDSELKPLLGEPLLPRGSIIRYIASCGTLKPLGSLIPLWEICCKNLSCAEGGLKDLTKHGDTGDHPRREKSSAG